MRTPRRPADLPDVFVGSHAVAEGLLTARQLRGPFVVPVLHGVYRPSWVPPTHLLRCQAACLVLPAAALVTGRSAATVLGLSLAGARDDVHVVVPESHTVPHRAGVRVRTARHAPAAGRVVDEVRLADPHRVGFDAAARLPLPDAVAHLDALARDGQLDLTAFGEWLRTCHDNDVVGVREAVSMADPRAESLPESRTRVLLRQAGYPVEPQVRVRMRGRVVARVDLAIEALKIAVEYDGRWHDEDVQRELDRDRWTALTEAGWLVVVVTVGMLRHPERLLAAVGAAVAARGGLP